MLVTMTECIKNLHLIFNEDEDNNKFIQNGVRPISRKRCQQICNLKAATIPLVGKGCQRVLRILLSCAMLLAGFPTSISASNTGECPTEQYIQLMGRAVVKCHGLEDFPFIYWYDSTDEDAIAFIQKVHGEVAGQGYTTGEFDIDNEGSLVINNVKIRDEKTFRVRVLDSALLGSSYDITLIVYVEPAEPLPVIPECSGQPTCILKGDSVRVLPTPPRIVVQGCEPFHPCHLSAQEAETITCAVNGVRPQLDLSIVTYSMNVAVTETAINSHKEDGLFYTTIEGRVDVSKITCKENVTVICQARGPAAYGFMSDAYVTVPVDGDDCAGPSTDMEIPDDGGSGNDGLGLVTMLTMLTMALLILVLTISVIIMGRRMYRRHLERSSRHGCNNGPL